jgi:hypothetical protein
VIQLTVIIDENGVIKNDINNIKRMPYLLRCSLPDRLDVKVRSLIKVLFYYKFSKCN